MRTISFKQRKSELWSNPTEHPKTCHSGQEPLLSVISLEALGIELDLQNQQLVILPISPTQTYLTIF
jgi:hypothetical protein